MTGKTEQREDEKERDRKRGRGMHARHCYEVERLKIMIGETVQLSFRVGGDRIVTERL